MKRIVAVFLLAASLVAAEDPAETAGKKYLADLVKGWSQKLPDEKVFGVYVGAKWLGSMKLSVKKSTAAAPAAYEAFASFDLDLAGKKLTERDTAVLQGDLTLVSAEESGTEHDEDYHAVTRVEGGKWMRHKEGGKEPGDTEGEMSPITTGSVAFLFYFVVPSAPEMVLREAQKDHTYHVKRIEKQKVRVRGKSQELSCVETTDEKGKKGEWYLDAQGGILEVRPDPDNPVCMRPVAPDQVGKDLPATTDAHPAVQAIIDYMVAMKKGDKAGALAQIDIQALAQSQGEDPKTVEGELAAYVTNPETQAKLPDVDTCRLMFLEAIEFEGGDDDGSVKWPGSRTFKLHKMKEGDRAGKWTIYDIEQ